MHYVITAPPPSPSGPARLIYHFDTQEVILAPGVAKRATVDDSNLTLAFNENVGTDYWEAGKLDPPAGERGDTCCSRHVVYNAPTQISNTGGSCTLSFGNPFKDAQTQLFNGPQSIPINVNVQGGCTGGRLRVDIFRKDVNGGFEPITVESSVQTDPNGPSSFKYGFNPAHIDTGLYRLELD